MILPPPAVQAGSEADGPAASERALRFLALLAECTGRLLAATDAAAMVDELFRLIQDELQLDVFFNYRVSADGMLVLEAHGGLTEAQARAGAVLEMGQAVCGRAARDRQPCHATAVQQSRDPMHDFIRQVGLDAYACTPLVQGGELLGTLGFGRRRTARFGEDELSFLHAVCHHVAIAKHRLRTEQELRQALIARENLLQELNHRVRNSLQLVIGTLAIEQADATTEESRAALASAQERVLVIASVHQRLYDEARLDGIELGALLRDLTVGIGASCAVPVHFHAGAECLLPVDRAVATALVVDELLRRRLALRRRGDAAPMVVRLGPGEGQTLRLDIADGAAIAAGAKALPRRVLTVLLRQLRAELRGELEGEAPLVLEFPVPCAAGARP